MLGCVVASIVVLASFAALSRPGQIAFWISWCKPWFLILMAVLTVGVCAVLGTVAYLCFERAGFLEDWKLAQGALAGATAAGLLRIDFGGPPANSAEVGVRNVTSRAFERLVGELNKNAAVKVRDWASQLTTQRLVFHADRSPATPEFRQVNEDNLNQAVELIKSDAKSQERARGRGILVAYVVAVFVLQYEPRPGSYD